MKKNQLIALLQNIKGNPEVKLWNGMVEDWMDIEVVESELVKECKEFVRFRFEASWKQENRTFEIPPDVQEEIDEEIEKAYKKEPWEFPNQYVSVEDEKRWYGNNRKKILLINGKLRGKSTYDRLGEMNY